jgi:hypothetical protein
MGAFRTISGKLGRRMVQMLGSLTHTSEKYTYLQYLRIPIDSSEAIVKKKMLFNNLDNEDATSFSKAFFQKSGLEWHCLLQAGRKKLFVSRH